MRAVLTDSDDSLGEAIFLGTLSTAPTTASNNISPSTDVDMFGFTVAAGQVVDFDIDTPLNGPGGLGSYIRLFNAVGTQLDFNNDAAAPGENSVGFDAYLRHTFSIAGNYYLGVSNYNNIAYNPLTGNGDLAGGANATGSYQLILQALPVDIDDALTEATALGAVTTSPIITSASITPDIDVDMVSFTVTAGQVVDFDIDTALNGPGGLGSYIRLFNAQGVQLDSNDDAAAPGETVGFDAYLRYTFAASGTYYLGVSNFNNALYNPVTGNGDSAGGLYSVGAYQLIVQAFEADANDPDDALNEATPLGGISTSPITVNNNIVPDTDVDMFQFSVTAGQVVDFDIDTPQNGPGGLGSYIRLFNAAGTLLNFNNDAAAPGENSVGFDAYLRHTFANAGTYYLGVSNYNNIAYNPLTGNGDRAGGANATGSYQLILQALPVDIDDALVEATALGAITTSPITIAAGVTPDIDVDMVSFTVTAGQVVDFDIDTALNGPGGLGSYIRLFNAQGVQLDSNDDAAAPGETLGYDAYLRYRFALAGTYYLGVSNFNNALYNPITGNGDTAGGLYSIGAYQLTLQAFEVDTSDPDDALSEAAPLGAVLTTPLTINSTISPSTDVDMFGFTVAAGQVVDFDIDTPLNGPGGLGSYIRLFNAAGTQLDFNNDAAAPGENSVGFDAYLRHTFSIAGNYYLGVSNYNNIAYNPLTGNGDLAGGANTTGSYQLILQALPVDIDDALAEATALGAVTTSPIITSTSITPDIDVDMVSFTVTAGQVVDFDIDTALNGPGGLGSYIRLFNAQGVQLDSNDDAAAPGEKIGFDAYLRYTFAFGGTYYLGVSNFNNALYNPVTGGGDTAGGLYSIGAYQLVVQAFDADANDPDDAINEATPLGAILTTPLTVNSIISPSTDVDTFGFTVAAGQVVDFDIDTPLNGPGGLGSYLRLFNSAGTQLDFNNDAAAPGENSVGFDAYLRHTFSIAGIYYLGVSNYNNIVYNPLTGNGDLAGGANTTGSYQLILQALPVDIDDALAEASALGVITTSPIITSASITPDIDVDMVSFTVTAGQIVDFDIDTALNGPGGLGSYIRLFNAQGVQLDSNDDAAAPGEALGFDAYLRYTFAFAGTYYLGISNFNNALYDPVTGGGDIAGGLYSIGNYQLIVQAVLPDANDPDDALNEAAPLGAVSTTAKTVNNNISPSTDVDMFAFTVTAGQVVDFDIDTPLNGPGGLGSYIRLFNSAGTQLDSNNDAAAPGENSVGFDAYLRHAFPTAGTFYIGVSNYNNIGYNPVTGDEDLSGGANTTGSYQLIVQALPVDSDDSLAEATDVGAITTSPITISTSVTPDIDVDMISFTVTAGQVVDFDIDTPLNGPGGLGSYIRLFNAQGVQIDSNDDAAAPNESLGFDAYLRYTFAAAGTYYLGVSNFNNALYDPVTGGGDTAGGLYSIGDYQLIVQAFEADTSDPDDALTEANPLGAISTLPLTVNNTISPSTDVDMFSFTVTAGLVVDFDIDTPLNGPGGLGSYLRLFNAAGTQLDFNNDAAAPGENSVGFDAYLRHTFPTAGTFYLGVSNYNNVGYDPLTGDEDLSGGANSTGSYQLILQALPVDINDSLVEATALGAITTSPSTSSGSVTPDIDVDMFSFTVTAGQIVDFDIDTPLNGPGGLGSYIRLFNAQGIQLDSNDDAPAPGETLGFDAYLRFTFAAAGSYYLGVSNFNNALYDPVTGGGDVAGGLYSIGNYQLIVQAFLPDASDPDDALSEAIQLGAILTTPSTVNNNISPSTDVDMFGFTVAAGQVVDFDIDTPLNGPGGLGSYIRLFNAAGTQLDFNNDAAAPGENSVGFDAYLRHTFPTAGTFYLGVSNYNNIGYSPLTGDEDLSGGANSTGSYQLILQALPVDNNDSLAEATALGAITSSPITLSGSVTPDIDVDMVSFTVTAGQVVDFDIDTPLNGPGGLGSYIRLFNAQGVQLDSNDDAPAPGETFGFDAYLRYTFAAAGTYYLGISNFNNVLYDPVTGGGDIAGGLYSIGNYQLTVQAIPTGLSGLTVAIHPDAIPEIGGTATGTVTRNIADFSQPLIVNLLSSDTAAAIVVSTIVIPANQQSVEFQVNAVHNTTRGTTSVTISAAALGFTADSATITVADSDQTWHNFREPLDVNDDGEVSPSDALSVINHLRTYGSGYLPEGNPPPYVDVNGDNQVSPLDALLVINYLNNRGDGEGESEAFVTSLHAKGVDSVFDQLEEGEPFGFDDQSLIALRRRMLYR